MPQVAEAYFQGHAFDETVYKKKQQHLWPNVKLFARINSAMPAFLKAIKKPRTRQQSKKKSDSDTFHTSGSQSAKPAFEKLSKLKVTAAVCSACE